jgi:hypothetical protein
VLAVPEAGSARAAAGLCDTYDVELTDIGAFTGSGRLVVRYAGAVVLDLANHFLHDGIPQRRFGGRLPPSARAGTEADWLTDLPLGTGRAGTLLLLACWRTPISPPKPASSASTTMRCRAARGQAADRRAERWALPMRSCSNRPGTPGRPAWCSAGINPEYGKRIPTAWPGAWSMKRCAMRWRSARTRAHRPAG